MQSIKSKKDILPKPPEKPFEHIRLYKTSKALLIATSVLIGNMSKKYKYVLGERLQDLCLSLCSNVAKAYNEDKSVKVKIAYLKKVQSNINDILILYRLLNGLSLLKSETYMEHLLIIHDASVQAADWIASV